MSRKPVHFHPLDQSQFYKIGSRKRLAEQFGLDIASLNEILSMERMFSHREMTEKRKGKIKTRVIQEPRGALRKVHIKVRWALSRIQPPDFLFCPVKRRSAVENAAQHLGAKEVRTLDVRNYFTSTPSHRVYWFFHKVMKCSTDVASMLAQLLTVDAHLATGSTVSPILSFFAFYDMWLEIGEVARKAGCTLTVYMDDITISGDRIPTGTLWEIRRRLNSRGLEYHKEKRFSKGVAEITGVILRDGRMAVPNRHLLKEHVTRSQLEAVSVEEQDPRDRARLRGLAEQKKQVADAFLRRTMS